jgi:hypothetical protein
LDAEKPVVGENLQYIVCHEVISYKAIILFVLCCGADVPCMERHSVLRLSMHDWGFRVPNRKGAAENRHAVFPPEKHSIQEEYLSWHIPP